MLKKFFFFLFLKIYKYLAYNFRYTNNEHVDTGLKLGKLIFHLMGSLTPLTSLPIELFEREAPERNTGFATAVA